MGLLERRGSRIMLTTRILVCWTLGSAVSAKVAMLTTPDESFIVDFKSPNAPVDARQTLGADIKTTQGHSRRRSRIPRKDCVTKDGPETGATCISPFKFVPTNKTYYGCTYDTSTEPWCSTKVNEFGYHLSGYWGVCSEECPVEEIDPEFESRECLTKHGHKCFFPFRADGTNYFGCVGDSSNGQGYCFAEDKEDSSRVVRDDCTAACPKDVLLTNTDYTAAEVLHTLMKKSQTSTKIKRRGITCTELMDKKFAEEDPANLPLPARNAKTWEEALQLVCAGANYCQGEETKGVTVCGAYHQFLRKNVVEDGHRRLPPKSDCILKCGNPND